MKAVILAAGRGTRLGSLTDDRPKPMIPIGGIPALEWIVNGNCSAGIQDLLIVVGYRGEFIRSHFGDGSAWHAKIEYIEQPVATGTGAALALARAYSEGAPVLCSFGDILTDPRNYRALVNEFDRSPCEAVIGINQMTDPSAGAAVYREGQRVIRVVEKPPPGTSVSQWNLAGVSVFGSAIFDSLAWLQPSRRGEIEITAAIEDLIASGHEVRACEFHGFWSDIGCPEALAEAETAFSRII